MPLPNLMQLFHKREVPSYVLYFRFVSFGDYLKGYSMDISFTKKHSSEVVYLCLPVSTFFI